MNHVCREKIELKKLKCDKDRKIWWPIVKAIILSFLKENIILKTSDVRGEGGGEWTENDAYYKL